MFEQYQAGAKVREVTGDTRIPHKVSRDDGRHVAAQNERRRLVKLEGRADPTGAESMPTLPRSSRAGDLFYSPAGMLDAAAGRVHPKALDEARLDTAFLLSEAYQPGCENLVLVTWIRRSGPDTVTPYFDPRVRGFPVDQVVLVMVGYTGRRMSSSKGEDRGQQAVMVLAPVSTVDDCPVATPAAVFDLTARVGVESDLGVLDPKTYPTVTAVGAVMGFNLCDTIRRFQDRQSASYGSQTAGSTGPVLTVDLSDDRNQATCVAGFVPIAAWNGPNGEMLRKGLRLSFSHLGPASFDRELPPTLGVAPWSVLRGNVYNDEAMFGGVVVTQPAQTQDAEPEIRDLPT